MGIKKLGSPKYYKECCTNLRHGIWGNTWKEWAQIFGAFFCLYLAVAALFCACLFTAKSIRNNQYMTIVNRWYGPFSRTKLPIRSTSQWTFNQMGFFNPPLQCTEVLRSVNGIQTSTGIQSCVNGDAKKGKNYAWTLYPWTLSAMGKSSSGALSRYPGCQTECGSDSGDCAQSTGSSFIARTTSPAYFSGADVPFLNPDYDDDVERLVCQNNVPYGGVDDVAADVDNEAVLDADVTSAVNPSGVTLITGRPAATA